MPSGGSRADVTGAGATARAYHEATKHSRESVRRRGHFLDWGNKPHPLKVYEGLERVALSRDLPDLGQSAVNALAAIGEPGGGPLDIDALSRLLRYGAGVLRVWHALGGERIWFRTYASAGALYPVEVYAVCGEVAGLEAGVYHFDPQGLALDVLRPGDHRAVVVDATAGEPDVSAAPLVLILTGIPWRTGWKYLERGYRHLFWDAGMIVANLLALAGAMDLPARVVTGFVDQALEQLLDLDGIKEFPLLALAVGDGAVGPGDPAGPIEPIQTTARPLSRREPVFEAITATNRAGRMASPADVRTWWEAMATAAGPTIREGGRGPRDGLEEVIRRRGSAREFGSRPIPVATLEMIFGLATSTIPTDCAPGGSGLITPHFIANAVEGLARGSYAFRDGEIELLEEGHFGAEAGYLCLEQDLGADAAATVFLMLDLELLLRLGGDRAYRVAQLEGGIVGGRTYLAAYAHRFGATGLTFYDDAVTRFFAHDGGEMSCMLVVAIGESPRLTRQGVRPL